MDMGEIAPPQAMRVWMGVLEKHSRLGEEAYGKADKTADGSSGTERQTQGGNV